MYAVTQKSPHKSSSANGLTCQGAPRKRAPPRCRICPEAPLKASCSCGQGRRKKTAAVVPTAVPAAISTHEATPVPQPSRHPLRSCTTPSSGQVYPLLGQSLLESLYGSGMPFSPVRADPGRAVSLIPFSLIPQGGQPLGLPFTTSPPLSQTTGIHSHAPSLPFNSSYRPLTQVPITPSVTRYLMQPETSSPPFPSSQPTSPGTSTPNNISQLYQIPSSPTPPTSKEEEELPEGVEFVEGAMQGTDPVEISRRYCLPNSIKKSSKSVKQFGQVMRETIVKVEHLAHQTGAWITIAGQHPHSKYDFFHFTSPQLRADALEQSSQIVTDFGDLVSGMISAQKADAREFQRNLQEEKDLRAAEASAHQAALDKIQAELNYALELAARYRETFGNLPT